MKFKTKKVTIEKEVFDIKEFSAKHRHDLYLYSKEEGSDPVSAQAKYIQMGCEQFKDKSVDEIFEMPGAIFTELAQAIMKISGLGEDDEKEAEKNS